MSNYKIKVWNAATNLEEHQRSENMDLTLNGLSIGTYAVLTTNDLTSIAATAAGYTDGAISQEVIDRDLAITAAIDQEVIDRNAAIAALTTNEIPEPAHAAVTASLNGTVITVSNILIGDTTIGQVRAAIAAVASSIVTLTDFGPGGHGLVSSINPVADVVSGFDTITVFSSVTTDTLVITSIDASPSNIQLALEYLNSDNLYATPARARMNTVVDTLNEYDLYAQQFTPHSIAPSVSAVNTAIENEVSARNAADTLIATAAQDLISAEADARVLAIANLTTAVIPEPLHPLTVVVTGTDVVINNVIYGETTTADIAAALDAAGANALLSYGVGSGSYLLERFPFESVVTPDGFNSIFPLPTIRSSNPTSSVYEITSTDGADPVQSLVTLAINEYNGNMYVTPARAMGMSVVNGLGGGYTPDMPLVPSALRNKVAPSVQAVLTAIGNEVTNRDAAITAAIDQEVIDRNAAIAASEGTAGDTYLALAGGTMTGDIVMSLNKITSSYVPVDATDLINKTALDNALLGINYANPVDAFNLLGNTLFAAINGITPEVGDQWVMLDAGTLTLGALSVMQGDLIEFSAAGTWVMLSAAVAGFPKAGLRAILAGAKGSVNAPYSGSDQDKIVVFDGTSLTATVTAEVVNKKAVNVQDVGHLSFFDNASYVYEGAVPTGMWIQFNGAAQIAPGVGLGKTGNTIYVKLGAGIGELPTGEVAVDLATDGGLELDGVTAAAKMRIAALGVTNEMLAGGIEQTKIGGLSTAFFNADLAAHGYANDAQASAEGYADGLIVDSGVFVAIGDEHTHTYSGDYINKALLATTYIAAEAELISHLQVGYIHADGIKIACADALANCNARLVSRSITMNEFYIKTGSFITHGLTTPVLGQPVYLDPVTPGAMTQTCPSTVGQYIVELGFVIDDRMEWAPRRPIAIL